MSAASGSLRRNAIANIASRSASIVLWVVLTPFVLARLGPERFAVWSFFLALGGNVASLDFGMANGVARYVALASAREDRRNLVVVLRRSLSVAAAIGLMWCVACMLFSRPIMHAIHVPAVLETEVVRSMMVFAVSMFVYSVTQVLNGALIGFQRLDLSNLCFLSGLTLHALVLVVGIHAGFGLMSAALAAIGGHFVSGVLSARLARRELRAMPDRETTERVSWREMLHFGGALQVTGICAVGQQQAWSYLLGMLGKLTWVTQFALGYRVANAVLSLPILIQGAVIPAAAHASAGGRGIQLAGVYDWACRWIFVLGGFVLAGLWLLAPAVLVLWLGPRAGESMADSVLVTRILAAAFTLALIAGPATAVARGAGWPLLETWYFVVALVLNLLLSLWLVPRYGPGGSAAAMGASYGLSGIWVIVVVHRLLSVPSGPWLLKQVLPRVVVPAAVAVVLERVWPMALPTGRLDALRLLLPQGLVFAALVLLITWPTGDAAALLARVRAIRRPAAPARPNEAHS